MANSRSTPPSEGWTVPILSKIAAEAPHALSLAAQLMGVGPCPTCNFIKRHCRCHEEGKGHE
jgi:hypothetical protein